MSHRKLVPNPFIPPSHKPEECECGGMKPGATGRTLIMCPACDGIVSFHTEPCDCGDTRFDELEAI